MCVCVSNSHSTVKVIIETNKHKLAIERLRVQISAGAAGKNFFSRINVVSRRLFGVRSTLVLPQWHIKGPGHSTKSAGGRLHLNTHALWTQRSRSGPTMLLSRHSADTYPETNSHATCQGTFGYSRLSSLIHYELILA